MCGYAGTRRSFGIRPPTGKIGRPQIEQKRVAQSYLLIVSASSTVDCPAEPSPIRSNPDCSRLVVIFAIICPDTGLGRTAHGDDYRVYVSDLDVRRLGYATAHTEAPS